jgi:diguanylate cyclase (GGDEF)-like protein/PAS domain S-box-containing protein
MSAEDALVTADFRQLLDESPELVAVFGLDGTILYANSAFAGALGYSPERLVGQGLSALVPSREAGQFHYVVSEAHDHGTAAPQELQFRHRDGTWRTLQAVPRPMVVGRERSAVAFYCRDVTGRTAAELARAAPPAEGRVALPGKAAFVERVARSLSRARYRADYRFAVLFLDLDGFKLVNESLGHVLGDEVLAEAGDRLRACMRPADMVAHVGGDEFAVLVDHIDDALEVTRVAERVQTAFGEPFLPATHEVFLTTSIGIALSAADYERPEDLLRDAELPMYRAKSLGRGRYEFFDAALHAAARARLKLETDLRRALRRGEFIIQYQPIVSLSSGEVTGFEALVRWDHPQRGRLQPADFLTAAEETGLIVPLSSWIIREACANAREWPLDGSAPVFLSLNLTGTHFTRSDVAGDVLSALGHSTFQPGRLVIEITESVMMHDTDSVLAALRRLKDAGVRVHIDDFGTGYSSLSYLFRLPTDALKIDRSFVARIGVDSDADFMVRTLIDLAHAFGKEVVAEGIETAGQLAVLRSLRCDQGQGFYFARPMDGGQVAPWMAANVKF